MWLALTRAPDFRADDALYPEPPTNVRIVQPDGSEIPVDCFYTMTDNAGIAHWEVMIPIGMESNKVKIDMFPGRTELHFRMKIEDDDED
jgi:hypothetical protein